MSTTIVIEPAASERQAEIRVRAEAADGTRSPATEPLAVTVPAIPPPSTTTSTTTTNVPGAGDGGTGDGGTGNGGDTGATTTSTTADTTTTSTAPTTSTTPPIEGPLELDPQPEERWAVMVPFLGEAGVDPDQLRAEIADAAGTTPDQIREFNNRDKVVTQKLGADPPSALALSGVEDGGIELGPEATYLFALVVDDDAANAGCATLEAIPRTCEPVRLRSAGHPGAIVRELDRRPIDTEVDQLDAAINAARQSRPTRSIHLLDGRDWEQFGTAEWIVVAIVTGGDDELCDSAESCPILSPAGG